MILLCFHMIMLDVIDLPKFFRGDSLALLCIFSQYDNFIGKSYITVLVVNYGVSNTAVLETP